MKIYNYHPLTREYIGQSDADKSPLEDGVFLIPANATDIKPPTTSENEIALFNEGLWEILSDYRGTEYWLTDGTKHIIEDIGELIPDGGSLDVVTTPAYPTQAAALHAVNEFAQSFTDTITGPVPLNEKLSWDAKEAAALAVIAGTATAEQLTLLDDEAALTKETTLDLANIIKNKAKLYRQVVSRVAGLRRALTAQIEAETDPYKYEAILLAGQIQAADLAKELGLSPNA